MFEIKLVIRFVSNERKKSLKNTMCDFLPKLAIIIIAEKRHAASRILILYLYRRFAAW